MCHVILRCDLHKLALAGYRGVAPPMERLSVGEREGADGDAADGGDEAGGGGGGGKRSHRKSRARARAARAGR